MNEITIEVRDYIAEEYEELCEADDNFADVVAREVENVVEENYQGYQQHRARAMQQMEAADGDGEIPEKPSEK